MTIDGLGEQIREMVLDWQSRLGLSHWTLGVSFALRDPETYADSHVDYQEYEIATIRFNTRLIRKDGMKAQDVEAIVIEELMHVLFWEMLRATGEEQEKAEHKVIARLTKVLTG